MSEEGRRNAQEVKSRLHYAVIIPAGSVARKCKRCPDMIYDVDMPSGKVAPVSLKHEEANIEPTDQLDGVGVNHFANCPAAQSFKKKAKE